MKNDNDGDEKQTPPVAANKQSQVAEAASKKAYAADKEMKDGPYNAPPDQIATARDAHAEAQTEHYKAALAHGDARNHEKMLHHVRQSDEHGRQAASYGQRVPPTPQIRDQSKD